MKPLKLTFAAIAAIAALAGAASAAYAGGASIQVTDEGSSITVSGSLGGITGAVAQVFFTSADSCGSETALAGDPKVSGWVGATETFSQSFSIKSLRDESPPTRSVCAYILAPNDLGVLAPIASSTGEVPSKSDGNHKKHHKHHKHHG